MWVVIIGAGLWFTLGSGLWQARHFGEIFTKTFGSLGKAGRAGQTGQGISPFSAMTTALASTAGTGNIAGVATAIVAGGPGAVFWMWVSSFLGMMTKYAEVFLAVKTRIKTKDGYRGGPMVYMEQMGWRVPAVIFCACGLLAALGVGNLTQINTMADAGQTVFGVSPAVTAAVTMALAGIALLGGIGSIAKVSEVLVPFMSGLYVLLCGVVLVLSRAEILPALRVIVVEAFSPGAAIGGVAGYTVMSALRYGVSRGVYTNEAGLGSAPMAHACAETDSPHKQGLWGAVEVFIDTLVICTMTALVILVSGAWRPGNAGGLDGASLTVTGFEAVLGPFGAMAVALCTMLFGFATILGWSFYGETCCRYLFHMKHSVPVYRALYILLLLPGALMQMEAVWALADIFNALMALPNLAAILALSGVVFAGLRQRE